MKRISLAAIALLTAMLGLVVLGPLTASAATTQSTATHSITTPVTGSDSNGDIFTGTFTVTRFAVQQHRLVAIGTLSGTIKNTAGQLVGQVSQAETLPVNLSSASSATSHTQGASTAVTPAATCSILNLNLGPLNLNLLGLVVHLNRVVLTINAQSGPGNLLGNLLCAVAGLLNGVNPPLGSVAGLLNQILALL
jgi:hypothetical protein